MVADAGSKSCDSDDWSIDEVSFQELQDPQNPFTVNLFADKANARLEKFYSNYFVPQSAGVDALTQDWSGENCWICPPVKLIIQIIEKIKRSRRSGCLVVPEPTSGLSFLTVPSMSRNHSSLQRNFIPTSLRILGPDQLSEADQNLTCWLYILTIVTIPVNLGKAE